MNRAIDWHRVVVCVDCVLVMFVGTVGNEIVKLSTILDNTDIADSIYEVLFSNGNHAHDIH